MPPVPPRSTRAEHGRGCDSVGVRVQMQGRLLRPAVGTLGMQAAGHADATSEQLPRVRMLPPSPPRACGRRVCTCPSGPRVAVPAFASPGCPWIPVCMLYLRLSGGQLRASWVVLYPQAFRSLLCYIGTPHTILRHTAYHMVWRQGEGTWGVGGGVGGYDTPDRGESAPKHDPAHEPLLTGGTPSRCGPLEP